MAGAKKRGLPKFPRKTGLRALRLTHSEELAVRIAVKTGLRMRKAERSLLFPRIYMLGYWHGIQTLTRALPEARYTVRVTRFWDRMTKRLKRLKSANGQPSNKERKVLHG